MCSRIYLSDIDNLLESSPLCFTQNIITMAMGTLNFLLYQIIRNKWNKLGFRLSATIMLMSAVITLPYCTIYRRRDD